MDGVVYVFDQMGLSLYEAKNEVAQLREHVAKLMAENAALRAQIPPERAGDEANRG